LQITTCVLCLAQIAEVRAAATGHRVQLDADDVAAGKVPAHARMLVDVCTRRCSPAPLTIGADARVYVPHVWTCAGRNSHEPRNAELSRRWRENLERKG
jgi:hypothetical protein